MRHRKQHSILRDEASTEHLACYLFVLAHTALMSSLPATEPLKTLPLRVRKAGGDQALDYYKIVVEKARIMSHQLRNAAYGSCELVEELRVAFFKVQVQYQPQQGSGGSGGATTFETEISPN